MRGTRVRNHPPVVPMLVSISTQANAMTLVWEAHAAQQAMEAEVRVSSQMRSLRIHFHPHLVATRNVFSRNNRQQRSRQLLNQAQIQL